LVFHTICSEGRTWWLAAEAGYGYYSGYLAGR
jgi:hypothetical protein